MLLILRCFEGSWALSLFHASILAGQINRRLGKMGIAVRLVICLLCLSAVLCSVARLFFYLCARKKEMVGENNMPDGGTSAKTRRVYRGSLHRQRSSLGLRLQPVKEVVDYSVFEGVVCGGAIRLERVACPAGSNKPSRDVKDDYNV
jgi:hypothetical protein